MPRKIGRGGANQAWRGGQAAPVRQDKYSWKPEEQAVGSSGRQFKFFALLGGTLLCIALIIGVILWLQRPPTPAFVVIGANPTTDAEQLDSPFDLYGWQAGRRFIDLGQRLTSGQEGSIWGSKTTSVVADGSNPISLPSDPKGLAEWANSLKSYDPVVIYVGTHCGTTPIDGPVIFTGGNATLPVKTLIETLSSEPLRKKKKLLLFDPGRMGPNVLLGQLNDDFARKMHELNEEISACPDLVVITGCDTNQSAWESEELQSTAFAHALLRGLNGEAASGASNLITARDLFDFTKRTTEEWTRDNRPSTQTPFLLPEGDAGLNRAGSINVAAKPSSPVDLSIAAATFNPSSELMAHWQRHEAMWHAEPSPAAYTPRSWRRYRELILRMERAERAGESDAATALNRFIDATANGMDEAQGLPTLQSVDSSLAIARIARPKSDWPGSDSSVGLGSDPTKTLLPDTEMDQARYAQRLLDLLADGGLNADRAGFAERLGRAAALLQKFPASQRPIEAHLPVMVNQFYQKVLAKPDTANGLWAVAVATRQRAEWAALGMDRNAETSTYVERIGPVIQPILNAADEKRRAAEDKLFSSDPQLTAEAEELLKQAWQGYDQATTIAVQLRTAFQVRDTIAADLPYYMEWAIARVTVGIEPDELRKLWASHSLFSDHLSDLLTQVENKELSSDDHAKTVMQLTEEAKTLQSDFDRIDGLFRQQLVSELNANAIQKGWWPKQLMLNTPLIAPADRKNLLQASRQISSLLLASGKAKPGLIAGSTTTRAESTESVGDRGRLHRMALGDISMNINADDNPDLARPAALDSDIINLRSAGENWQEQTTSLGKKLKEHYQALSTREKLSPTIDPVEERISRSTISLMTPKPWEPAAANRRLAWRNWLTVLADRTATDHWYDERGNTVATQPYFRDSAQRYLADAATMLKPLVSLGLDPFTPPEALTAKLDTPPLTASQREPMDWTSELEKSLQFRFTVPENYPIEGQAVGLRNLTDTAPLKVITPTNPNERDLLTIAANSEPTLSAKLQADITKEIQANCTASATLFFRGQSPTQRLTLDVQSRPNIVISEPLPTPEEDQASVAIIADSGLSLGQVAILIDFSGSMELPEKNSKKDQALAIFEDLLKRLPKETPLSVRVFSGKRDGRTIQGSEQIFFDKVSWQSGGDLSKFNGLMDRLRAIEPASITPLGDSIIDSIQSDFQQGGQFREVSKTLIVLTDGADQQFPEKNLDQSPGRIARIEKLNDRIRNAIIDSGVQVNVVRISQADDANQEQVDVSLTDKLFKGLDTLSTPGQVSKASDFEQLKVKLLNAIRPKLKLTSADVGTIPGFPRSGWPSRTQDDVEADARHRLYWSPLIPAGSYTGTAYPTRSQVGLYLEPGDRMMLGFFPQERGPLRIRRELYAESFREKKGTIVYREDGDWVMTVPAITVYDIISPPSLRATTFLENVPPHARRLNRNAPPETTLQQVRSPLMWWEIVPVTLNVQNEPTPGTPPKQVVIRKRYAFPAPTWEINAIDWPRQPSAAGYQSAQIQTWVADVQPKPTIANFTLDDTVRTTAPDGDSIEVQLSAESHEIGPKGASVPCLVVRVKHSEGRPVRVSYRSSVPHNIEHRYYEKAHSTTAMFGPFPLSQLRGGNIELQINSIAPLRDTPAKRITYISPRPTVGSQAEEEYRPQPGS